MAWAWVTLQRFASNFCVMGKALSGELSHTRTGLVKLLPVQIYLVPVLILLIILINRDNTIIFKLRVAIIECNTCTVCIATRISYKLSRGIAGANKLSF